MPKNPQYSSENKEILDQFNLQSNHNIRASIQAQDYKGSDSKSAVNELYRLLYGKDRVETFIEKERIANQFFADLIDGNSIQWQIKVNGVVSKTLEKIFVKYLKKTDFAVKLWQTKFKSGLYGKYGFVILKQETGLKTSTGLKKAIPQIIPVRIIYKNEINGNIFDIEVEFEGYNFSNGKTLFTLHRSYSLLNNELSIDKSLVRLDNKTRALESDLNDSLKENINLNSEKFSAKFVPVSVLINNYDELARIHQVKSRLCMLDKFDETLAILPAWEKGSINFTASPVVPENNKSQLEELMKNILLRGMNQFKPIDTDGNLHNLSENLVLLKPASIIQTVKATRDLIWNEIKEDLGLPSLNEVKSAQKTSIEVIAKQFLTSPIIEREKMFVKNFLKDFAKKFITILSTCEIDEKMPSFEPEDLEIELEFDLTTEKNINQTAQQITSSSNSLTEEAKIEVEPKKDGVEDEDGWWEKFKALFRRRR